LLSDWGRWFMAGVHSGRGTVRFGVFEADFRAGELRKRGVKVRLQEQPLQILRLLLQHPGEVVTREELRQKIWPADTFVDFEQGLYNAVKRLRDALKDSADKPRFIETLSRHGYRFIGTIDESVRKFESLAVLPLENLSRDPEQDYFAEGLTEALITTLAKIGKLRVASRTSIMQYKSVRRPLPEIARELGVDAIVEGTVLRAKDRVRITAQLIDAARESHLWAETYEQDLRDVLALQSELAKAIAREVQVQLTPEEKTLLAQARPVNPEAYEAYLKGRYCWNRRTGDTLRKGAEYFQQAIEKDPTYAAACAGLADYFSSIGFWGFVPPENGCGKAKTLALRALEIDDRLAEAHASLGFALLNYDWDFLAAEESFQRAIQLNSRYATGHQWYGHCLCCMGRLDEGLAELEQALRLDPLSLHIKVNYTVFLWIAGQYDRALKQSQEAVALDPNFAGAWWAFALASQGKSMHEKTIMAFKKADDLNPGAFEFGLTAVYAIAGKRGEALSNLAKWKELSKQRYVSAYWFAQAYTALQEKDEALCWFERAFKERSAWMTILKVDPWLDPLRSDPRFQDLLRRMNFPA
jgi:TolB-like protein